MNKSFTLLFILIFLLCLLVTNLHSQWISQSSGTSNTLRDIHFINNNTGFFCGDGVIGKTINGGLNWTLLDHPAGNKILFSINPINENMIYCAGWFETILKSTDGGSSWIEIRNGPTGQGASYFTSYFLNSQTGWVTGSSLKMLKTTNGGVTMDSIYVFIGVIRDIYFKDSLNGILCGEGGGIYKTTNGGLNWYRPNIQLNGNLYNFYQLSVVNDSLVWLIGNANPVYRSTDFGANWDSIGYVTGSDETYTVYFTNALTGYCGGTFGRLFKTTDSGYSWKQENSVFFNGFYRDIIFLNDTVGWNCGGAGRIQYTESGGEILVSVSNLSNEIPEEFTLSQNYPNPFNASTTINFDIRTKGIYQLTLISILGKTELEILNKELSIGRYAVNVDMERFPSGIYIYSLKGTNKTLSKRLVLTK